MRSPEYHSAHLAFSRAAIVARAADGRPILDLLLRYTEDVREAERDRATQRTESVGSKHP